MISCLPTRAAFLIGSLLIPAGSASADWSKVKKFLQSDVEIVQESEERLVLHHPACDRQITLDTGSESAATADIVGTLRRQRGGNPYRVWSATTRFWTDPERPKSQWGLFFRVEFLSILRPPKEAA